MKRIYIYIVIFLLIVLCFWHFNIYDYKNNKNDKICNEIIEKYNFLNGYWTSDSEFAKMSEIDEMILNIDSITKKGFLVIIVDNKIASNDEFDILIDIGCKDIEFVSNKIDFIWNEKKFTMNISIYKGSLILYHNDMVYAKLYKDNKMSSILNL